MSGDPRRSVERGEWLSTCRPGTLGGVVVPPVRDSDELCLAELDRRATIPFSAWNCQLILHACSRCRQGHVDILV